MFNVKNLRVKLKVFWVHITGYGQIDHEESENRGPESLEFIILLPGPKKKK